MQAMATSSSGGAGLVGEARGSEISFDSYTSATYYPAHISAAHGLGPDPSHATGNHLV